MKNVCHMIRKSTQLRSPFILNQMKNHKTYKPHYVFREKRDKEVDGGHAEYSSDYKFLDLSTRENSFDKLMYRGPKILGRNLQNEILKFINLNKIDILHFHFGSDCGVYYPLLQHLNIPSLVSFYGYDCTSFPKKYFGYGKLFLQRRVFSKATKITAMSPDMKNDLFELGCPEEKVIVYYHGIHTSTFFYERKYSVSNTFTLLTLSSLKEKKGHIFQLRSIKKLIDSGYTNFKFKIIGSGPLENSLKTYIEENSLVEFVEFMGSVKYGSEKMKREFQNADIFLHPSVTSKDGDKEGIPGALIEAMASGLPVVSTYHAGIPYVIDNGVNGLLVNEWDIKSLTDAVKSLIDDQNLREKLGKNGQNYAVDNLSLEQKGEDLESIYDKLIGVN